MIAFHRQAKKKGKTKKNSTGKRGKKAAKKSKGVKDRKKKSESESGASEESNKETEEQRRKREEKEAEDEKKKEESEKKKAEKAMEKAKEREEGCFPEGFTKRHPGWVCWPRDLLLPFPQLSIWSRGPHVNYWSFALDPTSLRITPSGAQQDQCADFQSHISWWQASQYDPWPGFGLAGLAVRFGGDGPAGKGHDGEHWGIFILVFSTLCFDGSPGPHSIVWI